MSKKMKWMQAADLPPMVQKMLSRFEAVSGLHDSGYKVTYYRNDAVFVQVYGMANLYMLARLVSNTDIYCELEATSVSYWTLRMFASAWMIENEVARKKPTINQPIKDHLIMGSVWVRSDAHSAI